MDDQRSGVEDDRVGQEARDSPEGVQAGSPTDSAANSWVASPTNQVALPSQPDEPCSDEHRPDERRVNELESSEASEAAAILGRLERELAKRIVGQKSVSDALLIALVAEGHVLLEGLPGLAKTTTIKALASATHLSFQRLQFTPDLLPADVVGTQIYEPAKGSFTTRKGPIFANLVLADEINRAPAKVQSALLEAMEERQVTIGGETFKLPRPFLVLATQNPIDQEGTYTLPEAQLDRFLFKVRVDYGSADQEKEVMRRAAEPTVSPLDEVLSADQLTLLQSYAKRVYVADAVRDYIVSLVFATRPPDVGEDRTTGSSRVGSNRELSRPGGCARHIEVGASPRASINLERAARIAALQQGRTYVVPGDVVQVARPVLRHRLLLTYEAEAQGLTPDAVIDQLLSQVDAP